MTPSAHIPKTKESKSPKPSSDMLTNEDIKMLRFHSDLGPVPNPSETEPDVKPCVYNDLDKLVEVNCYGACVVHQLRVRSLIRRQKS